MAARAAVADEVAAFLNREAAYLDNAQLASWLDLFREDSTYWIPAYDHEEGQAPGHRVSLIHDDKRRLRERVGRLVGGRAPSAVPLVRTLHIIGNVTVDEQADGMIDCGSNQAIYFSRGERQGVLPAAVSYRLCPHTDSFSIVRKKVVLLGPDPQLSGVGLLL